MTASVGNAACDKNFKETVQSRNSRACALLYQKESQSDHDNKRQSAREHSCRPPATLPKPDLPKWRQASEEHTAEIRQKPAVPCTGRPVVYTEQKSQSDHDNQQTLRREHPNRPPQPLPPPDSRKREQAAIATSECVRYQGDHNNQQASRREKRTWPPQPLPQPDSWKREQVVCSIALAKSKEHTAETRQGQAIPCTSRPVVNTEQELEGDQNNQQTSRRENCIRAPQPLPQADSWKREQAACFIASARSAEHTAEIRQGQAVPCASRPVVTTEQSNKVSEGDHDNIRTSRREHRNRPPQPLPPPDSRNREQAACSISSATSAEHTAETRKGSAVPCTSRPVVNIEQESQSDHNHQQTLRRENWNRPPQPLPPPDSQKREQAASATSEEHTAKTRQGPTISYANRSVVNTEQSLPPPHTTTAVSRTRHISQPDLSQVGQRDVPSEKDCLEVTKKIRDKFECKSLAISLNVENAVCMVEQFFTKYDDVKSVALDILVNWRNSKGEDATMERLYSALVDIGRKDIADSCCKPKEGTMLCDRDVLLLLKHIKENSTSQLRNPLLRFIKALEFKSKSLVYTVALQKATVGCFEDAMLAALLAWNESSPHGLQREELSLALRKSGCSELADFVSSIQDPCNPYAEWHNGPTVVAGKTRPYSTVNFLVNAEALESAEEEEVIVWAPSNYPEISKDSAISCCSSASDVS